MSIYNKLASIQTELKLEKTGRNPHFRSEYFELSEILNKLRPLLAKNKTALFQTMEYNSVVTKLIDLEDETKSVVSSVLIPTGLDAQKMGSAITYLKRYSLTGMFLIEERDDDANAAVVKEESADKAETPSAPSTVATLPVAVQTTAVKKKVSFSKKSFAKPAAAPVATTTGDEDL